MSTDQKVTLNAGAGGSNVRTLEVKTLQPDGTIATVEMQVLSIADPQGQPLSLDFGRIETLLGEINDKLERMLFTKGGL